MKLHNFDLSLSSNLQSFSDAPFIPILSQLASLLLFTWDKLALNGIGTLSGFSLNLSQKSHHAPPWPLSEIQQLFPHFIQFPNFFCCCCWWWLKGSRIGASPREVHFLQDSPLIPNSNKRMKIKFKLIMMIIRVVTLVIIRVIIITMSTESMEVTIGNMMIWLLIGYYSGIHGNSMRFQVAGGESLGRWR